MSFRRAEKAEEQAVLSYFEKDMKNCLYSYIDLKKYGMDNENLSIYINGSGEEEIQTLATKYYNGLTLYHNTEVPFHAKDALTLIHSLAPSMINGRTDLIKAIEPYLRSYKREDGFVTEWKREPSQGVREENAILRAGEEEFLEIAKLICSDEGLGGHYEPEELKAQLLERRREGFGRNYIIKEDERIVCHGATYAEIPEAAVISGIITREGYRGRGLAYGVVNELCRDLGNEGKKVFLFYYTEEAGRLYHKLGFEKGALWSKLVKLPCVVM